VGLGIAVPAAVIASRGESEGAVGKLRTEQPTAREEQGKELFIQTCKSCHTLAAVNARGVTGPDLDDLGGLDRQRVMNAIKRGGTGQGRMPSGLLQGQDAQDVATYVSQVAGQ
jgi:mono/diheme cytochrome c family protein